MGQLVLDQVGPAVQPMGIERPIALHRSQRRCRSRYGVELELFGIVPDVRRPGRRPHRAVDEKQATMALADVSAPQFPLKLRLESLSGQIAGSLARGAAHGRAI